MKKTLLVLVILVSIFNFSLSAINLDDLEKQDKKEQTNNSQKYVKIELESIPTAEERKALETRGIFLVRYISGTTYYAIVEKKQTLQKTKSRTNDIVSEVSTIDAKSKLDSYLKKGEIPEHAIVSEGVVRIIVAYFPDTDLSLIGSYIKDKKLKDFELYKAFKMFNISIPFDLVIDLASQSWVRKIECISPPYEFNNIEARTMNRAELLSYTGIGGRGLTGEGMNVGIWDANVEGHPDLGKRLHTQEFTSSNSHGQHVAGTMVGSGLLNIRARGMAPEAEVYTWNFQNGNTQAEMLRGIQEFDIAITQNSYGISNKLYCETPSEYRMNDEQLDWLVNKFSYVTHVFSAGNDQYICPDQGPYRTSTKRVKNAILVGAVDKYTNMSDFSSWGPMDDGRILPHVVANGTDILSTVYNNSYEQEDWQGTSMACPAISGLTTLLYQRYKQINGGENPLSSLIKGALLNTAEDLGNKGPDYQFGFGRADGEKAIEILEKKQYFIGRLTHEQSNSYDITIPAGATELSVMLVWNDVEGTAGDKALINDLDLKVINGGSITYPWILNPAIPEEPAIKAVDRLNNQEQVTIENPNTSYTIKIEGYKIPGEEQEYAVVYSYKMPELRMIYPNGGEVFSPGEKIMVRWNSIGYNGNQKLELSTDGGATFQTLEAEVAAGKHDVLFDVPATITDKAILRVTQGGTMDVSDLPFVIMGTPQNLKLTNSPCSVSGWNLGWDAVDGAVKYKILRANPAEETYSIIGESASLSFELPNLSTAEMNIYTVKAVDASGIESERAIAVIADNSGTLPITPTALPFMETFEQTPSSYIEIDKGVNVKQEYVQLGSSSDPTSKSKALSFAGDSELTTSWNSTDVYANKANVAEAKICNIDATNITGNLWLRFGSVIQTTTPGNANFRVLINGNPVANNIGRVNIDSTPKGQTVQYYDLSDYVGQEFSVSIQTAVRDTEDQVIFAYIYILEAKNDVGITNMIVPAHSGNLTADEKVSISIKNNDGEDISNVPVKLYLEGQLVAEEVVAGPIPAFKTLDYTFARGVDLTIPNKLYEIKAETALKGDINESNDIMIKNTANFGDYYRIPPYENYMPVEKTITSEIIKFTDDGAKVLNYSDNFQGGVVFKPQTAGARVKLKFTEFNTHPNDKVIIHDGPYVSSPILAVLSGNMTTPMEFIADNYSNEFLVVFESTGTNNETGWLAEVSETTEEPTNNFVNNTFSLERIDNSNGYFTEPQTIYIEVVNNSNNAQTNVEVQYRVDKGDWNTETISSIPAGQAVKYGFTKKADITVSQKRYFIEAQVLNEDVDLEDNETSKFITNDRYCVSRVGSYSYKPAIFIKQVAKDKVLHETSSKNAESNVPQYFRDVIFEVYKNKDDDKLEVTVSAVELGALALWVDWNNDGDFEDGSEAIGEIAVSQGVNTHSIPISIPASVGEGNYNIRLRVASTPNITVCKDDGYGINGEVEDYTIKVVNEYPYPTDLSIEGTNLKSGNGLTDSELVKVTILNNGTETVNEFEVAYKINGGSEVKETVSTAIVPNASIEYTFTAEANLSAGGPYKIELYTILDKDDNSENDKLVVDITNEVPASDGFYALDFDGKDDLVNLGSLNDTNLESFTLETWMNPKTAGGYGSVGFGRLFEGKGATVFLVATHNFYPENSIVISSIGDGTFMSPANTVNYNVWQHIAISFDATTQTVKLFVNGQETPLTAYKPITTAPEDNTTNELYVGNRQDLQRAFNGMLDEVRVWNIVKNQTDIQSGMYAHQKGAANLVAEFSFDEGYYNTKVYSDKLQGTIMNAESLDDSEQSIWVEPTDLLYTIHYPEQVIDWEVNDYKWGTEVEQGTDLTNMVGTFTPTWPNVVANVQGTAQISGVTSNDFTNSENTPVPFELATTVFGRDLQETYLLTIVEEKSTECELLSIEIPGVGFNPNPITQQMTFEVDETTDLTSLTTNFTVSNGATVWIGDKQIISGESLDFSKPIVFTVVAANGRATNEYSVVLKKKQTLTWAVGPNERVKTYGDVAFNLTAETSSENPVYYTSSDENILKIVLDEAQIKGVGTVSITANASEDNSTIGAEPITYTFTVNKKDLTITAEDKEVDYLEEIPELTMKFDGFAYSENEEVLDELPTISTTATLGSVAGKYDITLTGGTDDNYNYILNKGALTIKPTNAQEVTFEVAYEGNPEIGATITVDGREITTGANGKASIRLNPGTYSYSVVKDGRETFEGELTVVDTPVTETVPMMNLLPRFKITFKTDGNGTIDGPAIQQVKQGTDATPVTAKPKFGYVFDKWSDGTASATYIVKNVEAEATYTATFKAKTFTLQYHGGDHGTIEGQASQTVSYSQDATEVKVLAEQGYSFKQWSDGNTDNPRKDVNVGMDINVTAEYNKVYYAPYKQTFHGTEKPADWAITDNSGDGCVWEFKTKSEHYMAEPLKGSSPNSAVMDGYKCGYSTANRSSLISPLFDFSDNSTITLKFNHEFYNKYNNSQVGGLAYKIGSQDWVVFEKFDAQVANNTIYEKKIDAVAGQSNVQFSWTFADGSGYWTVDDIEIKATTAASEYEVVYRAGANGSLKNANPDGTVTATVAHGDDGPEVLAVADPGYAFYQWSDGNTDNPRKDKVVFELDVTAEFGKDCSLAIAKLPYLEDFNAKQEAPDCWEAPATAGNFTWEFGDMLIYSIPVKLGTTGNTAFFSSAKTNYGQEESADLISPEFDLSNYPVVYLSFMHHHEYYDTKSVVSVSYSLDKGDTWNVIKLWTGYTDQPEYFQQKVDEIAGQSSVILKWNSTTTWQFGWIIDDVELKTKPNYMLKYSVPAVKIGDDWVELGTIDGEWLQLVDEGEDGTSVKAIPANGYKFVQWSDGSTDNPRQDLDVTHTISVDAYFEKITSGTTHTLTYVAGTGGTISGTAIQTVKEGESGTAVEAIPDTGYEFVKWSDGSTDNPRTDTNVTMNINVTAEFMKITPSDKEFILDYRTDIGGTLYGTITQKVKEGESGTAVEAIPDTGYEFVQWSDGVMENPRVDAGITADITVSAEFKKLDLPTVTYPLTYVAGAGGTLSGTLSQTVEEGQDGTPVEAIADANHEFVKWSDGVTDNPRIDENVSRAINATAEFKETTTVADPSATFTLTYTTIAGGEFEKYAYPAVTEKVQSVKYGEDGAPIEAFAEHGYEFVKWSDGVTDNPRTDTNVTENITVQALFTLKMFTLSYDTDGNGTISGTTTQTVPYGKAGNPVEAIANPGYQFLEWSDGEVDNPRRDLIVFLNRTVTAIFREVDTPSSKYSLTYTADANGTISGEANQTVISGNSGTAVEAIPNTDYKFVKWSDGSTDNPRTDTDVRGDIDIEAIFVGVNEVFTLNYKDTYSLWGGTISGTAEQTVKGGENGTPVEAIPNPGRTFDGWSDGVLDNPRQDLLVMKDVGVYPKFGFLKTYYSLSYNAGLGGNVTGKTFQRITDMSGTASGTPVEAVANSGYEFVKWSDGRTENPRIDINVVESLAVEALFSQVATIELNYTVGEGGTLSGTTTQEVNSGDSGTPVEALPNIGYKFVQWSDGVTDNPRIDKDVTGEISVVAKFELETYSVVYDTDGNGIISGNKTQTVSYGSSSSEVTANANTDYEFWKWSDGRIDNPRSDENVTKDISVIATFKNIAVTEYTLTYIAGTGGTISGTATQTVEEGKSGSTVEALAGSGYEFVKWSDGVTDNPRTDADVSANISVTAEFELKTYTVTYNTDGNGTISGTATQTVSHGSSSTSVEALADSGYEFVKWSDGSTDNPRKDTNVTSDISVVAEFAEIVTPPTEYTLSYTAGNGGRISGEATQRVEKGESGSTVEAIAGSGYEFVKWSDGSTDNPRKDTNVTSDISVVAVFAEIVTPPTEYTLSYTAGNGGRISGEATQRVEKGESGSTVEAIAGSGYEFVKWSDGSTDNPRKDTNVTSDISVVAVFAEIVTPPTEYTLSYTAGNGGRISGEATQRVEKGESGSTVEAIADSGYEFVKWSDGSTDNPRKDTNVTSNISVVAEFSEIVTPPTEYTLSYTAGNGGRISGEATQTVEEGESGSTVEAIADSGYEFVKWSDGSTDNPRKDTNVTSDISVVAEFAEIVTPPIEYTLSYTAGNGGRISGEATQTVEEGESGSTVEAIAGSGYEFVKWSDGSTDNPRKDMNVTSDISVVAEFAEIVTPPTEYTLSYTAGNGGRISGEATQRVEKGESGSTVEAIADSGYEFVKWSDGSTDNPRKDTNVTSDISVVAEFSEIVTPPTEYTLSYTAGNGGRISGEASQTVEEGESGSTVEAIADSGYEFVKWSDGSTDNPRKDTNVTSDISVVAEFSEIVTPPTEYTLSYTAGNGGRISGEATQTVEEGESGSTVEAIADSGYEFVKWSDGSTDNPRKDMNVTSDISVVAEFGEILPKSFNYIKAPQIITPDGNGINDKWCLPDLEERLLSGISNIVRIFDKEGKEVYHKEDYMKDGECFDGDGLSDGLYYYVIEVEDGFKTKGFFYIIRKNP
ncbi:InlB B-repeat-containing protein [Balneicella halophila]|nr:InlB B-repeat-containing protein [Balneicella halophila]